MEARAARSLFSVSEVELVYRNKIKPNDRIKLNCSASAYDVFLQAWDMNKIELVEQFMILMLDCSQSCLGVSKVATGGMSVCVADPKIIFATALKARAASLILAHNHPSGNITPSKADILLTQKLVEGGKILEVPVLDHLIVTPHTYYSFTDNGLHL